MGHTRTYANKMNLAAMTPQGGLSTTGYCLAATGHEYLVYLPDGGEVTVDLTATQGALAVEWMHPVEGTITLGEPTVGGSKQQFKAPFVYFLRLWQLVTAVIKVQSILFDVPDKALFALSAKSNF